MNKFAIITAVLVVSALAIMGDFVIRDFVARQGQTSVITTNTTVTPDKEVQKPTDSSQSNESVQVLPTDTNDVFDSTPPATNVTEEIIKASGFTGSFKEKHFEGKIYQLLDITKNPVSAMSYYEVLEGESPVASITELILPDEIRALQMYVLLQNKTKTYIDLTLNETNAYGDRSFYINHAKKPDEAFLTVKIGKTIYCFAYVKSYHPQVKKLISLLAG